MIRFNRRSMFEFVGSLSLREVCFSKKHQKSVFFFYPYKQLFPIFPLCVIYSRLDVDVIMCYSRLDVDVIMCYSRLDVDVIMYSYTYVQTRYK